MFFIIDILKNFGNFTEKHLCWSPFLIKLPKTCNLIKKRLQHRYFPVKFADFKNTFLNRKPTVANSEFRKILFWNHLEHFWGKYKFFHKIDCVLVATLEVVFVYFNYSHMKSNLKYSNILQFQIATALNLPDWF